MTFSRNSPGTNIQNNTGSGKVHRNASCALFGCDFNFQSVDSTDLMKETHGGEETLPITPERWNSHSVFPYRLTTSLVRFLIMTFLITSVASTTFPIGTNLTRTFIHELTLQDAEYSCTASLIGMPQPFFYSNQIDPRGLKPGQDGRVDVRVEKEQTNLTIVLVIANLGKEDKGTYVVNVAELKGNYVKSNVSTIKVDVTFSPGTATCELQKPFPPVSHWITVYCNATAGSSDNLGNITCLQNAKHVPYLQPSTTIDEQISASFWIDNSLPAVCCSTADVSVIGEDSCKDFVYAPSRRNYSTTNPSSSTSAMSTSAVASDVPCAVTYQPSIAGIVVGTAAATTFVLLLILAVCYKMCSRSRSYRGNAALQTNGFTAATNGHVGNTGSHNIARECVPVVDSNGHVGTPHNNVAECVPMIDRNGHIGSTRENTDICVPFSHS